MYISVGARHQLSKIGLKGIAADASRTPTQNQGLGALQPAVGNTTGIATPFSVHHPMKTGTS